MALNGLPESSLTFLTCVFNGNWLRPLTAFFSTGLFIFSTVVDFTNIVLLNYSFREECVSSLLSPKRPCPMTAMVFKGSNWF